MKNLYIFLALLALVSCKNYKTYEYIEINEDPSALSALYKETEDDPVEIEAESDSAAYIEAYNKFIISKKVYKDMIAEHHSLLKEPVDFKLLDENKRDIAVSINFAKKDSILAQIEKQIYAMPSHTSNVDTQTDTKVMTDSVKIKQLSGYFDTKKDEFSPEGLTWYEPKSRPNYTNMNGFYCYFQKTDTGVSNFRMRFQYAADDWLFIEKIQFSIDGEAYEFIPREVETDNGSGGIWEWFDEKITYVDKNLVEALANAKSVKMKLIGSQYHHVQQVTPKQLLNIKRSLELYKAMGGQF